MHKLINKYNTFEHAIPTSYKEVSEETLNMYYHVMNNFL